jgi:anti-sigma B factor antagonist
MLEINSRTMGQVVVLDLHGTLIVVLGLETLRDKLKELFDQGQLHVLLNLKDASVIDSQGIGDLVAAFSRLKKSGGTLKLANPNKLIGDVLRITRLPTIIDVFDSEEEALNAFTKQT